MDHGDASPTTFWRTPTGITLLVALLAMGFYLVTEHTAHVLGFVPYLLVLACPLMHLFMHRGHHGGHGAPRSGEQHDQRQQ